MMKAGYGFVMLAGLGLGPADASAQALTPMRGEIVSYADEFAVRVYPRNPYKHPIRMAVRVYDKNFAPVRAAIAPRSVVVGAGRSYPVVVVVGFEGKYLRAVRICAESVPFPNQSTQVRGQVCGRFIARRVP